MDFNQIDYIALGLCVLAVLFGGFFNRVSNSIGRARTGVLKEQSDRGSYLAKLAILIIRYEGWFITTSELGGVMSLALLTQNSIRVGHSVADLFNTGRASLYGTQIATLAFWTAAFFLVGEIGRAASLADPENTLRRRGVLFLFFALLLSPIVVVLRPLLLLFLSIAEIEVLRERDLIASSEEIEELVARSQEAGSIDSQEGDLIQSVVNFSDTVVREVMVPRNAIVTVSESAALKDVLKVFISEKNSRLVVIGNNLDDVRGVLIVKDLLPLIVRSTSLFTVKEYMRPAYFVPNSKKIDELLYDMRKQRIHLAVVLDEHGGVDGIVTIEDLLEEIVGEISDEHDSPFDEVGVYRTRSGDLLVDGSMSLDDLRIDCGIDLPAGEYDTIGGFMMHHLGKVPAVGDKIEQDAVILKAERLSRSRISLVRIAGNREVPVSKSEQ